MSMKAQQREKEKSSMLFRFKEAKKQELGGFGGGRKERPWDPWTITSTVVAEKWRKQVLREITDQITRIVDERLSEFQIRDKNDEINVLVREKDQWEMRIKELGGPDYMKAGIKTVDAQGREVPGNKGYKYYGRAKNLPGVKELFSSNDGSEIVMTKSRKEMYRHVDADYYGYRDEEDGKIVEYERNYEEKELEAVLQAMAERPKSIREQIESDPRQDNESEEILIPEYVTIPSQQQVEAWLVQCRRDKLMEQYLPKT